MNKSLWHVFLFACFPIVIFAMEGDDELLIKPTRRRRRPLRRYDSLNKNIKRFSQEYSKKDIEQEALTEEVIVTKRNRRRTSKRPRRRNVEINTNLPVLFADNNLQTTGLGGATGFAGIASHFIPASLSLDIAEAKDVRDYSGSQERHVYFSQEASDESSYSEDDFSTSKLFLQHGQEGSVYTLTRGGMSNFDHFVKKKLRRRSDPSAKRKRNDGADWNLVKFNYTGNLEKKGRRYSSVVSSMDRKKRKVTRLLLQLLLVLKLPVAKWQEVWTAEMDLLKRLEQDELSEFERNHRISAFMEDQKLKGNYVVQMQEKINALKYLYAKNIHALNYLYDFDIFKTCNCYIKYGGCPDKCHRKKYVNKYVKELFTNEDYLASIRNKQINANNLQWD